MHRDIIIEDTVADVRLDILNFSSHNNVQIVLAELAELMVFVSQKLCLCVRYQCMHRTILANYDHKPKPNLLHGFTCRVGYRPVLPAEHLCQWAAFIITNEYY